jgi:hypothetical protein
MAMEGFTSMLREGMGDVEAKFFVPGRGFTKELVEVKDHQVPPADFWKEIKRFQQLDAGSPGEYQWFTLASAGLSESLHPLVNSLRRLRGPMDSTVTTRSLWITRIGIMSTSLSNWEELQKRRAFCTQK